MLSKIKPILGSPAINKLLITGVNLVGNSRSKKLPPITLGGSIILGVLTALFGCYKIVDCVRYQTEAGQCDVVIKENLPALAASIGTISAGWAGFNTFNPKLHTESTTTTTTTLPTKELVVVEENNTELVVKTSTLPHPEVIQNLYAEGNSQVKVAKMLGISLYAVRKALKSNKKKQTTKVRK